MRVAMPGLSAPLNTFAFDESALGRVSEYSWSGASAFVRVYYFIAQPREIGERDQNISTGKGFGNV